ncbi:MAG: VPS10 domain-containing protein, partial [Vicinamibacterales bacterium]
AGAGRGATTAVGVDKTPSGLYRSDDAGATWRKVNNENARPMYFSQVRIDPNDPETVFYAGVKLHKTVDGGKTVTLNVTQTIHDDVHAIWIDPANSNHLIIGNDGGVAISWDSAKTWNFVHNIPVGLFYHVSVDNATPYNICGGMQDNYAWCGPSAVRGTVGIAGFNWAVMQGGDGFVALQDPADFRIAYSESQDGNMVRIDRVTGETISIRPQANAGEPPLRWNWDTPLILSPSDPKVVYAAANKVFRSANRGLNWETAGSDLTGNDDRDQIVTMGVKGSDIRISKDDGIQAWPTIVSLAESPKRAGVTYAGTDNGHLQVSRDGGRSWTDVADKIPGLPKGIWVSEVVPSRFDEATVYATFDGHRQNDFETYIYVSHDSGGTWQTASGNLKGEVIKTLTEDLKSPDVLYAGAETGLFVSIDRAKSWVRVKANLPTVRIDEITLHPRDNAMILATHGRALWILDHLEPIQEYAAAQAAAADAKLFTLPPSAMFRRPARDRNYEFWGDQTFFGENPPGAAIVSWLNKKPVGDVKLKITDAAGREVRELSGKPFANSNKAGIQSACWDLRVQPNPAPPPAEGRGGRGTGRAGAAAAAGQAGRSGEAAETGAGPAPEPPATSPFGAGCPVATTGGGGGFAGGVNVNGPYVIGGVYTVALLVDGKTIDSKPLRVNEDPEVALTAVERKRMFDQAMEIHALQPRLIEAATAHAALTRQLADATTAVSAKSDVPADVKAALEALTKEVAALAPRVAAPAGGRGGGGRGQTENLSAKLTQAKNGLTAGMSPADPTVRAYTEVKAQTPRAIADLNAAIARATTLGATLLRYNVTLTAPAPVKMPEASTPTRRAARP